MRYEVQAFTLTSGLRLDLYVLHGGLVAQDAWQRWAPSGALTLPTGARRRWAQTLAGELTVVVDGQPRAVEPDDWRFPEFESFSACADPIVVRAPVTGDVPRGRAVPCRVEVRPSDRYALLARVSFVAPRSVELTDLRRESAAATATVTWPAAAEPDTRLPQLTPPDWFYELPQNLALPPLLPGAPRDRVPVAAPPAGRLTTGPHWPAWALAGAAGAAAWLARRRGSRRPGGPPAA